MVVHRRGLEHRGVDVDEAAIIVGRLTEIHRDMMAEPAVVHLALDSREVPREVCDMSTLRIRLDCRARAHRKTAAEFDAVDLRNSRREPRVDRVGLPHAQAVICPAPGSTQRPPLPRADLLPFYI